MGGSCVTSRASDNHNHVFAFVSEDTRVTTCVCESPGLCCYNSTNHFPGRSARGAVSVKTQQKASDLNESPVREVILRVVCRLTRLARGSCVTSRACQREQVVFGRKQK